MIICGGLLLLVLSCVIGDVHNEMVYTATDKEILDQASYNEKLTQLVKRDSEVPVTPSNPDDTATLKSVNSNKTDLKAPHIDVAAEGLNEGGGSVKLSLTPPESPVISKDKVNATIKTTTQNETNPVKVNETSVSAPKVDNKENGLVTNSTEAESLLHSPGVVKRGLIVFGGFTLLAVAYFVFYRRKGKNYDSSNSHNANDTNQFRYGVLQSEDRRDNLELSRIPLTMESDEDDEEDLEIFDLEQKKKSLSYVNLQSNDEDIVLRSSKDESKNNLLLDIEDGSSDTLINWSNSGNNSIL